MAVRSFFFFFFLKKLLKSLSWKVNTQFDEDTHSVVLLRSRLFGRLLLGGATVCVPRLRRRVAGSCQFWRVQTKEEDEEVAAGKHTDREKQAEVEAVQSAHSECLWRSHVPLTSSAKEEFELPGCRTLTRPIRY